MTAGDADDFDRVLFGRPLCAKGYGECARDCEYGLAGPCVNEGEPTVTNPTSAVAKPSLGPPRLFIEVIREVGNSGTFVRSRKEIALLVWQGARSPASIVAHEINTCLQECEQYGN